MRSGSYRCQWSRLWPFRASTSAQRLRLFAEVGIDARQLAAGALGGEHPLHAGAGGVALLLPGLYLGEQPFALADTPVEALGAQDADLDLDHVEPTGVLRRVVELQALEHTVRLRRREGLVQRARRMRRKVVHHHPDQLGLGVM